MRMRTPSGSWPIRLVAGQSSERIRSRGPVLAELAGLDSRDSPEIVLHGDAHGGNLPPTVRGWLWADMEETCRGPREWDLMVLAGRAARASAASASAPGAPGAVSPSEVALIAYAAVTGTPRPAPEMLIPLARARELEAAVWSLGMAHQYPSRYRSVAQELLARVLPR